LEVGEELRLEDGHVTRQCSARRTLLRHECIGYRFPSARTVYRWQFQQKGREFSADVVGSLVVNDHLSMIALAKAGAGLAYTADLVAARELSEAACGRCCGPIFP
jgi:DNA-binding transcriptional LysR family regulator